MNERRDRPPLITPRFATVVASGICYFLSIGVVIPAIPRYVKHRLDGGSLAVGIVVGALFVGAGETFHIWNPKLFLDDANVPEDLKDIARFRLEERGL